MEILQLSSQQTNLPLLFPPQRISVKSLLLGRCLLGFTSNQSLWKVRTDISAREENEGKPAMRKQKSSLWKSYCDRQPKRGNQNPLIPWPSLLFGCNYNHWKSTFCQESKASLVHWFSHNICCQGLPCCLPGNLPTCQSEWKQQTGRQWVLLAGKTFPISTPFSAASGKAQPSPLPEVPYGEPRAMPGISELGITPLPAGWRAGDVQDESLLRKKQSRFLSWQRTCCCISYLGW